MGSSRIRLEKGDITDQAIDAFVYYARHDLKLGSGFGTAIAGRGGSSIQKELGAFAPIDTGDAVITGAGALKARRIIHAVGPRFQEPDMEQKLRRTMESCLALAEKDGIRRVAFPAMGAGFYGVPLDMSARVMVSAIRAHLENGSALEEVAIVTVDQRELKAFQTQLEARPA